MNVAIGQMILESSSFTHRDDYLQLLPSTPISASTVGLQIQLERPEDDGSKVIVRLTASSVEGSIYQFSVAYVALLLLALEANEVLPEDIDRRLMVTGSSMLYPFMREHIATLTGKGRFGAIWLAPSNFNDLVPNNVPPPAPANRAP